MQSHTSAVSAFTGEDRPLFLVWEKGDTFTREVHALCVCGGKTESTSCVCFFSLAFGPKESLCRSGMFWSLLVLTCLRENEEFYNLSVQKAFRIHSVGTSM